jgi:hypothetical protein
MSPNYNSQYIDCTLYDLRGLLTKLTSELLYTFTYRHARDLAHSTQTLFLHPPTTTTAAVGTEDLARHHVSRTIFCKEEEEEGRHHL